MDPVTRRGARITDFATSAAPGRPVAPQRGCPSPPFQIRMVRPMYGRSFGENRHICVDFPRCGATSAGRDGGEGEGMAKTQGTQGDRARERGVRKPRWSTSAAGCLGSPDVGGPRKTGLAAVGAGLFFEEAWAASRWSSSGGSPFGSMGLAGAGVIKLPLGVGDPFRDALCWAGRCATRSAGYWLLFAPRSCVPTGRVRSVQHRGEGPPCGRRADPARRRRPPGPLTDQQSLI